MVAEASRVKAPSPNTKARRAKDNAELEPIAAEIAYDDLPDGHFVTASDLIRYCGNGYRWVSGHHHRIWSA